MIWSQKCFLKSHLYPFGEEKPHKFKQSIIFIKKMYQHYKINTEDLC